MAKKDKEYFPSLRRATHKAWLAERKAEEDKDAKAAKRRYKVLAKELVKTAKKKSTKRTMTMGELESRLSECTVRQLIVAMRLMRTDKDTVGFDYSKLRKEDLLERAHIMARGMSVDKREKTIRQMAKAFGWTADTSGKATGKAGDGSGKYAGSSDKDPAEGDPGKDRYGHYEGERHGPNQGGAGEDGGMTPEEVEKRIEEAVAKAMQGKTDELMDKISKSVFKIEVETAGADGEGDGEGDGDSDQEGENGSQGDGQEGSEGSEGQEAGQEGQQGKDGKQAKGSGGQRQSKGKGKSTRVIDDATSRHKVFQEVCQAVNKGLNVLLVGPAGCGKTHMAQDIAKVLDLSFRFTGAVSSEYKLLGFTTAQGQLVRTEYREAYENGGLFLWDELDASSAQALLSFNAGLANGHQDFPDKVIPQHKLFRAVASANTYGNGADRMYIGRNQLDAASLDRFYVVNMDYDETLERALYGSDEWVLYVQAARRAMREIGGIRHVISMRAIQMGLKMKGTGVSRAQVEQSCLWRHLQKDDVEKIKRAMRK